MNKFASLGLLGFTTAVLTLVALSSAEADSRPRNRPTPCGRNFAFCDTFDAPARSPGPRTVDLEPARWSAGRIAPQLASFGDCTICAGAATIPTCRPGVGSKVFPDRDTLVCVPRAGVASAHLLVAVASQNYGLNSYRIRQPFDFAKRTGKIVFDVEAHAQEALLGWVSLEVSADPTPTPSYTNFEYGPLQRSEVSFQVKVCEGISSPRVGVREGRVFRNFAQSMLKPHFEVDGDDCLLTADDRMNRFEVRLSRTSIEVFGTDKSADGVTFAKPRRVYAANLDLDFERGYVSITTRNHASLKYTEGALDAWVVRWDNVGFDGNVHANFREYSVPDSLTKTSEGGRNLGYRLPQDTSSPLSLELDNVNPAGAVRAALAFTTYYPLCCESSDYSKYNLRYRVNGGKWHDRFLDRAELKAISLPDQHGAHNQTIALDPAELKNGRNQFQFVTAGVSQGFDAAIANIDLILTTR